jgi:hypothetical protein
MPPEDVRRHPHLFDPNAAARHDFTTPRPGRGKSISLQARDRAQHAAHLLGQLEAIAVEAAERREEQAAAGIDGGYGIYLKFAGAAGFDLKFESLEFARSGIELCAVREAPNNRVEATVFVPDGKLEFFLKRITDYRDGDKNPKKDGSTEPKNRDLIESVDDIQVAALEALWTDDRALFPDLDTPATFEVWLRKSSALDHVQRFRQVAAANALAVSEETISFVDRVIVLVFGRAGDLARSVDLLGAIAEVRLAKTAASFFTKLNAVEQQDWVADLAGRLRAPPANAPFVCLLDSGLNRGHPLISPVAADQDLHTYKPAWGVDDRAPHHGTPMAGLAVYGDLVEPLASQGPWPLTHRLESVKIINSADPHAPALYGAVTIESANRVEIIPDRQRIYCMAISTTDGRDRGRPSSWSAAVDALASGAKDGVRRLFVLSAGNTDGAARRHYPDSNMTDGVHDPGQAWNALTVGGYTEKALVDQARFPGWEALAPHSDLAPAACTSVTWTNTKWPLKPDFVLEAGNMARHPNHHDPDYIDDALQLLTTPHNFAYNRPLVTFGDTSAAAALASRMAAMLWAKYPNLTPEAVRALLVHSATWTDPMLRRFTRDGRIDHASLLRCFGYGVPRMRDVLSSADNALTLIAQGEIQPFHKVDSAIKYRELKLHALPWPMDVLEGLQDEPVTLRVTLSYFVEPNPGDRGWTSKYGYQSHGLRFAVKRATETLQAFQKRINKAAREEDEDTSNFGETGAWMLRPDHKLTTVGSIHSNIWEGTAAELAARGHIAIFPTYGWWNKRPNLDAWGKVSRYALIVTIKTPRTDIYTPVATQIRAPIVVET